MIYIIIIIIIETKNKNTLSFKLIINSIYIDKRG